MNEFELKLEIPTKKVDAVRDALAAQRSTHVHLRAIYLDTRDHALAQAGIALRLRQEGTQWVQTVKAPVRGSIERLEHNVQVDVPAGRQAPSADLSRHDATPLGKRLRAALPKAQGMAPALVSVFETDMERTLRTVRHDDSTLELALDQGRILAAGRSQEVCELEIELKAGQPRDAIALARQWAGEHGLWLNSLSKAQRGHLLAQGRLAGPAVPAQRMTYGRHASSGDVVAAVLGSCLAQVIANASEIARGSNDSDHVHQLRVGIRRLRTALRELQVLQPLDLGVEPVLVEVFRALGEHRDRVHGVRSVAPRIEAAGGPALALQSLGETPPDPGERVRTPAFQDALFNLLLQQADAQAATGRPRKPIVKALRRLWRDAVRDGEHFTRLEEAKQHRVRKRLKRLRYLAEFAAPLFPSHRVERFLNELKPVQDALGEYNDELMALSTWREFAQTDAAAWFGVGWLEARREPLARDCRKALRRLAKARTFWD